PDRDVRVPQRPDIWGPEFGWQQLQLLDLDLRALDWCDLMATLPSPRTWNHEDEVTAQAMNDDLSGYQFFMNPPMCHLSPDVPVASRWDGGDVPGDGAEVLHWRNPLDIDTDGMFDPAFNTRLYFRTAGWYEVTLHIDWQRTSGSWTNAGNRYATIQKNNN